MKTSKQLFARRRELDSRQHELMAEDNVDEARIIEGQIRELDITIEHVLDEEAKMRDSFQPVHESKGFSELVLGARDSFKPLELGFRSEGNPVVHIGSPTETDLEIPGKSPALLANFASTIPEKAASGAIEFQRRVADVGAVGTWSGVDSETGESALKEKVIYKWEPAIALTEVLAGYVPVSKKTLRDYDELQSIIETDLLIDLDDKEDAAYMAGNNSNGIIGAINTPGIQTFSTGMGGLYWEAIRKMRTQCMVNGRAIPTHVCMHPDIKQEIDLYKTQQGFYQNLSDHFWGMIPEEDFNCPGILVYDAFAMLRRPVGGTVVEVGYVDDQFIKNELCILAERESAFQVKKPTSLVYASKTSLDA
ncbi:MAG: phage major capsid protein [Eggerthellaceae bacterium]|nr:phage major capsid protein [Eggerthellaceae bacterium]